MIKYVLINKNNEYLTNTLGDNGYHISTKDVNLAQSGKTPFESGIPHDAVACMKVVFNDNNEIVSIKKVRKYWN